jgi:hypothetical protein
MAALSIKAKAHRKAQQKEYRSANIERIRAYDKARSATQKVKDRLKEYRLSNCKHVAAKARAYKTAHKQKLANDQKEYRIEGALENMALKALTQRPILPESVSRKAISAPIAEFD